MIYRGKILTKGIIWNLTLTLPKASALAAEQRQAHTLAAKGYFEQARSVAESGQIAEASSLILKGLDRERRAGCAGPQVMQLIKPRA